MKIIANEAWQTYYRKSLTDPNFLKFHTHHQHEEYDCECSCSLNEAKVKSLFDATLQQILDATQSALNSSFITAAIVAPQHFRGTPSLRWLMETAVQKQILRALHQVAPGLNGARLAYNLDSCASFGLSPGEKCDMSDNNGGPNYILVATYDSDRFTLGMLDTTYYVCQDSNIRSYEQYGEASGSIVSFLLFYALLPFRLRLTAGFS